MFGNHAWVIENLVDLASYAELNGLPHTQDALLSAVSAAVLESGMFSLVSDVVETHRREKRPEDRREGSGNVVYLDFNHERSESIE